ncbi:MAG: hypothetical protein ABWZ91_02390 [Nocardioides sp.]
MEIAVEVPVRVCDVGGWTDTWFAGHGLVCSLAAGPGVSISARSQPGTGEVTLDLADYGMQVIASSAPPEHSLLAAAVTEAGAVDATDVVMRITSAVPPGSSLGTSAAICVGIIAALDALRGSSRPPEGLAAAAHRAEAGRLGRQAGVQDQAAAAHGGASLIVVDYPRLVRHPIALAPDGWRALDERLVHIAYGPPHDSSAIHDEVIASLDAAGPSAPRLEALRVLAAEAGDALRSGDLARYGRALTSATGAQMALHSALVSDDARELIERARTHGALGWKVNGAGGAGGSLSVLCRDPGDRERVGADARRLGHQTLDLRLDQRGATARVSDR